MSDRWEDRPQVPGEHEQPPCPDYLRHDRWPACHHNNCALHRRRVVAAMKDRVEPQLRRVAEQYTHHPIKRAGTDIGLGVTVMVDPVTGRVVPWE